MIDDSWVWKDRLRRERANMRRKLKLLSEPEKSEAAWVAVEAFVFLTAYIVRKLIEARKLSDELEQAQMRVTAYPATGYRLDFMHTDQIDRGYDLNQPYVKQLSLRALCNILIHSFVFLPSTDEVGFACTGFFVNSDRTKNRELFYVFWNDFNLLVDEVVRDDIAHMEIDHIRDRVTKSRFIESEEKIPVSLNVS